MKFCSKCGKIVYSYFTKCPYCGSEFCEGMTSTSDVSSNNTRQGKRQRNVYSKWERNDGVREFNYAKKYDYGIGVEKNLEVAFEWYMKAAVLGHAEAQYKIGEAYYNGEGTGEDLEEAFAWYMKAAEQDQEDAQYSLGYMYAHGEGVKKDLEEAFDWYMKAAAQEHTEAQYEIGEAYYYGNGIEEDLDEAFSWYMRAAKQDHADAQYKVAGMYYNGEGVEEDLEESFGWLKKAADQNHADAQFEVGEAYYYGDGTEQDLKEALVWYKKATEQDHADAQYAIGYMCYYGQGCRKNVKKAVIWLNKSESNGNKNAKELLKEIFANSVLYVYKDNIDCREHNHHFILATATLLGKHEKRVVLDVNYCLDCGKLFIKYVDYKDYRDIYGYLIGNIQFDERSKSGKRDIGTLAEESTLMLCGYNVNARNNLKESERHHIISKLLDKGIMTKAEVINYLRYFISFIGKKPGNAQAVGKWQNDLRFTLQYKINKQLSVYFTKVKKWPSKRRKK